MKYCAICDGPFTPRNNSKTCSVTCSGALKLRRAKRNAQGRYILAGVNARKRDARDIKAAIRFNRKVNRAVHLLFRLTGEHST